MSITKKDAQLIITTINGALGSALDRLVDPHERDGKGVTPSGPEKGKDFQGQAMPGGPVALPGLPTDGKKLNADQEEALYRRFKNRLIDEARVDPMLLRLLTTHPEIEITVERQVVEIDGTSLKGRVAKLMSQGFFSEPRRAGAVRSELARTGSDPNSSRLSETFSEYVIQGFLTREGDSYLLAPGVKVTERTLEK